VHDPACASWEEHVDRAYAALHDGDDYNLSDFADFLLHSWDNERLTDDPEFSPGGTEAAA
jgi:hypothetical protein